MPGATIHTKGTTMQNFSILGYTATDDLWKVRSTAPKGYTATDDLWKVRSTAPKGYTATDDLWK